MFLHEPTSMFVYEPTIIVCLYMNLLCVITLPASDPFTFRATGAQFLFAISISLTTNDNT